MTLDSVRYDGNEVVFSIRLTNSHAKVPREGLTGRKKTGKEIQKNEKNSLVDVSLG